MNPEQKKRKNALLARQILSAGKVKALPARPVQAGPRVNMASLLKPKTKLS